MDVLMRIKWAVLTGRYRFTNKARIEMKIDDLTELDVRRIDSECTRNIQETSINQSFTKQTTRIPLRNSWY